MNSNLKNIPTQFLKNLSLNDNYNTEVHISSTKINKKSLEIQNNTNDNIWILIMMLIMSINLQNL